jgi:hypothetical protein
MSQTTFLGQSCGNKIIKDISVGDKYIIYKWFLSLIYNLYLYFLPCSTYT